MGPPPDAEVRDPLVHTPIQSWITPKACKGSASSIQGRGVRTTSPISAGEIVAVKGGRIVTRATVASLPEEIRNKQKIESA